MSEIKKNITSIFIVPTLLIKREDLIENGYINGYIKDGRHTVDYPNCVYLLFKPKDLDKFEVFLEEEYKRTKQIVDNYDYESGFVVVVYELDSKFKKDFNLVKRGKYSKTSKEFKDVFPKVLKIKKDGLHRDEISLQYRVFNKTEDLKKFWEDKFGIEFEDDMELWHGFEIEKETLNLDKIKEYV